MSCRFVSDHNDSILNLRFHRFAEGTEAEDDTEAHPEETENTSNEARPDETTADNTDSCQRLEDTNCPSEEGQSTERVECNREETETRDGTVAMAPGRLCIGWYRLYTDETVLELTLIQIEGRWPRGSRDGAVLKALASQQCGPGSIPGLGVICGLSLLPGFLKNQRF